MGNVRAAVLVKPKAGHVPGVNPIHLGSCPARRAWPWRA